MTTSNSIHREAQPARAAHALSCPPKTTAPPSNPHNPSPSAQPVRSPALFPPPPLHKPTNQSNQPTGANQPNQTNPPGMADDRPRVEAVIGRLLETLKGGGGFAARRGRQGPGHILAQEVRVREAGLKPPDHQPRITTSRPVRQARPAAKISTRPNQKRWPPPPPGVAAPTAQEPTPPPQLAHHPTWPHLPPQPPPTHPPNNPPIPPTPNHRPPIATACWRPCGSTWRTRRAPRHGVGPPGFAPGF
jgi:hypothetical protein